MLICLCLWVCDCVCVCVCYFEYIARSHCWNVERTVPTTLYHSWNAQYKAGSHLGDAKHNVTRTFAQPLNCRTQSEQDIESQLKHPVQCAGQLLGLKSACRHSFNAIDTPNSSIKVKMCVEPKRCAFKNLDVCVSRKKWMKVAFRQSLARSTHRILWDGSSSKMKMRVSLQRWGMAALRMAALSRQLRMAAPWNMFSSVLCAPVIRTFPNFWMQPFSAIGTPATLSSL